MWVAPFGGSSVRLETEILPLEVDAELPVGAEADSDPRVAVTVYRSSPSAQTSMKEPSVSRVGFQGQRCVDGPERGKGDLEMLLVRPLVPRSGGDDLFPPGGDALGCEEPDAVFEPAGAVMRAGDKAQAQVDGHGGRRRENEEIVHGVLYVDGREIRLRHEERSPRGNPRVKSPGEEPVTGGDPGDVGPVPFRVRAGCTRVGIPVDNPRGGRVAVDEEIEVSRGQSAIHHPHVGTASGEGGGEARTVLNHVRENRRAAQIQHRSGPFPRLDVRHLRPAGDISCRVPGDLSRVKPRMDSRRPPAERRNFPRKTAFLGLEVEKDGELRWIPSLRPHGLTLGRNHRRLAGDQRKRLDLPQVGNDLDAGKGDHSPEEEEKKRDMGTRYGFQSACSPGPHIVRALDAPS